MIPNGRYFIRRQVESKHDHEESYWVNAVDPDGAVRDFTKEHERTRYLADVHQEIAFINAQPAGRVLDVGCGLGFLLSGLDDRWEKHGVEISAFAAGHARRWASVHEGSLESGEFPSESFDLVVMHHVIEHIPDPVQTIKEVHRILKGRGVLLLATPDFDSGCARRFGANYRLLHDPTHISLFSNESMHRFLRDFGFVIDRVEYPFFETRHFSKQNLERLFDRDQVSPAFYGNFMTFYCHKPVGGAAYAAISGQHSRWLNRGEDSAAIIDGIARRCVSALAQGHSLWLNCPTQPSWFIEWLGSCGLPMVKAALLSKSGSGVRETGLGSGGVRIALDLQDCETRFSAGDVIIAVSVGAPSPGYAAKLRELQTTNDLVVEAIPRSEDQDESDARTRNLVMGSSDGDPEGLKVLIALSAFAARCRELSDGRR